MASIVIKDLPESVDLDRKAMAAITGGMRARGHQIGLRHTFVRSVEVSRQATASGRGWLANADARAAGRTLLK